MWMAQERARRSSGGDRCKGLGYIGLCPRSRVLCATWRAVVWVGRWVGKVDVRVGKWVGGCVGGRVGVSRRERAGLWLGFHIWCFVR